MAKIPNFYARRDRYGRETYRFHRQVPNDLRDKIGKAKVVIQLGHNMPEAIAEVYRLNDQYTEMFRVLRKPNHKDYQKLKTRAVQIQIQPIYTRCDLQQT